jgi:hypothetical protein
MALRLALGPAASTIIGSIAFNCCFGFECRQILGDGPLLTLLLRPLEFVGCLAVIAARVRLDDL